MKQVYMIFRREDIANGNFDAYTSKRFTTREAANDYIARVLEPEDRAQGIYEPNFYAVEDLTRYYA